MYAERSRLTNDQLPQGRGLGSPPLHVPEGPARRFSFRPLSPDFLAAHGYSDRNGNSEATLRLSEVLLVLRVSAHARSATTAVPVRRLGSGAAGRPGPGSWGTFGDRWILSALERDGLGAQVWEGAPANERSADKREGAQRASHSARAPQRGVGRFPRGRRGCGDEREPVSVEPLVFIRSENVFCFFFFFNF